MKTLIVLILSIVSLQAQQPFYLTWTSNSQAQAIKLYKVYEMFGTNKVFVSAVPSNIYVFPSYVPTNARIFTVTASNIFGESSNSIPAVGPQQAAPPSGLEIIHLNSITVPLPSTIEYSRFWDASYKEHIKLIPATNGVQVTFSVLPTDPALFIRQKQVPILTPAMLPR